MKKYISVLLVALAIAAFAVTPVLAQGEEPPTPGPVTVPIDLENLIKIGVSFLVTGGLKSISRRIGKDISGWAAVITASIVSTIILFSNALLSATPTNAQPFVATLLALIVTIFGAFGVHEALKELRPVQAKK